MEYLFLFSSCILFSLQYIFSKLYHQKSGGTASASFVSSVLTSLFGVVYCVIFATVTGKEVIFSVPHDALLYAMIYAFAGIGCSLAFFLGLNYGNLWILTTYSLLGGMVLPCFYGVVFNNEPITLLRCVGTAILIISLFPTAIESAKKDIVSANAKGGRVIFPLLCIFVFIGNGMTGVISKIHQLSENAISSNAFVMIGSLGRAVLSAIILVIYIFVTRNKKCESTTKIKLTFKLVLYLGFLLFCYAVIHSMGDVSSLLCAKTMDSSVQFSFISAFVILATALIGKFLFGEKIGKAQKISLALVVIGITLMLFANLFKQ